MNNIIKEKRLENNMTLEQLGDKVGVGKSTVRKWENGMIENMRRDNIVKLSKALDIPVTDILGINKNDMPEDITTIYNQLNSDRQTKVYNYAQHELEEQNKVIDINEKKGIYLQSKVSAGTGVLDLDPTYGETISYDGEIPNHYDLAFLVSGNSMTPTFEDGEIIFVEKYPNPINGAIMVVQIDEQAYIKKVYLEKDNLRLVSLNQDYDDILANEDNNIRIVGKVVF
ncbi:XRE family transcriptional regulator [Tetragenococcus halophilus]|uniref:Helix-turn-helix transcriptional regulator n=1 Tax=Tetragenococcus halophilus TaxID=51669 RepID=A0AB35HLW3_TETHA|nr:helix-turn-helix transcriptional regulator [Tetragenococcus halophilus]